MMKLAYHGCWFRIELELFPQTAPLRRYDVLPRKKMFVIERELLRRVRRKLREAESDGALKR